MFLFSVFYVLSIVLTWANPFPRTKYENAHIRMNRLWMANSKPVWNVIATVGQPNMVVVSLHWRHIWLELTCFSHTLTSFWLTVHLGWPWSCNSLWRRTVQLDWQGGRCEAKRYDEDVNGNLFCVHLAPFFSCAINVHRSKTVCVPTKQLCIWVDDALVSDARWCSLLISSDTTAHLPTTRSCSSSSCITILHALVTHLLKCSPATMSLPLGTRFLSLIACSVV